MPMRNDTGTRSRSRKPDTVCRRYGAFAKASMTLEAAVVLPLFLMAVITLVSFMDAVRIQTEASLKLSNQARKLAAAAGVTGSENEGPWIDLCVPKTYQYPFPLLGVPKLRIAVRARVYPWIGTGQKLGSKEEREEQDAKVYYITDNQEVRHLDPNCTHIDLTIIKTTTSEVGGLRNAYGRKYRKCEGFPKNYHGDVYVTAKGNYYYPSTDYGGLTRHVHVVTEAEAGSLPLCSRCGR